MGHLKVLEFQHLSILAQAQCIVKGHAGFPAVRGFGALPHLLTAVSAPAIVNHMVKQNDQLDDVFSALADPTRRGMLEQLARGEANVGTLGAPHAMSAPAVSRHLRVLERAGLIVRARHGREHRIRVDPRPIEAASSWIAHYARFWKQQFDAVDAYLKARAREAQQRAKDGA